MLKFRPPLTVGRGDVKWLVAVPEGDLQKLVRGSPPQEMGTAMPSFASEVRRLHTGHENALRPREIGALCECPDFSRHGILTGSRSNRGEDDPRARGGDSCRRSTTTPADMEPLLAALSARNSGATAVTVPDGGGADAQGVV